MNKMKAMNYLIVGGVGYLILMMFKKVEPTQQDSGEENVPTLGWGVWTPIASSRNDANTHTYELQENTRTTKKILVSGYSVRTYYRILEDGQVKNDRNNLITDYASAYNIYIGYLGAGNLSQQDLDSASPVGQLTTAMSGNAMNQSVTPSSSNIGSRTSSRALAWR